MSYPEDPYQQDKPKQDFEPYYQGKPAFQDYDPSMQGALKERGGCLTAFLIFVIFANIVSLIMVCGKYSNFEDESYLYENPGLVETVLIVAGVVQLGIFISAVALWNWKRWGYYGLIVGYLLGMGANLVIGNILGLIGGIVGLVILASLVNPRMDMLE